MKNTTHNSALSFRLKMMDNTLKHFSASLSFILIAFFSFSQTTEVYDTPGGGSWTVPCGVTSITVAVYGGGGGGGGSNTGGQTGGGGGAGGYAEWTWVVVPGTTYNYFVGSGGSPGAPGFNGGAGQQSNWDGGILFANGGSGGLGDNNGGGGGAGGTASGWATNQTGGNGFSGGVMIGGFGGSAGGPNGGAGGQGGPSGIAGTVGNSYGGGGGGGGEKSGSSNPPGGAGASGAVVITYTSTVTQPDAGPDQNSCTITNLAGNTPDVGWTGTWTVIAGSATITDPNDPNSAISGIAPGSCATIEWRFTSPGCPDIVDVVTLCYPLVCNDDPCGATPISVSSGSCSYSTYSNVGSTASTGMAEPGCGSYLDNDVWFVATVPANGVLTINATDAAGGSNMYPGLALYSGPDCSNLLHNGCDYSTSLSASSPAELTYTGTPGETVYIRYWNYFEYESDFQLCAWSPSVATGDITAGPTSVTCGTPMTFMDPGGTGNYEQNTFAQYVLCPDTPGQYVTIDFCSGPNFFDVENGYDLLTVLDGDYDSSQIIDQYTGTTIPCIITSGTADGCLTLQFQSDNIIDDLGWLATVSCTSTQATNSYQCSPTNCSGECGQWICQDGLYPTTNDGNNVEDLAVGTSGCFGAAGEVASKWFYFSIDAAGTIEFTFDGPNGQDYDFAVWGPSTDSIPPCPMNTGEAPIRCSFAAVGNTGNPVGLNDALGDPEQFEGAEGDGWVDALDVQVGETYAMILNIYMNGNPQPEIDLTIGGTGSLDCTPVLLPVTLVSFKGINQGDYNSISWITNQELNNDFFTIERSVNGFDWELVGIEDAVGNTTKASYYSMRDENPYFPVTYYRLKQTDVDGEFTYSEVIAVNVNRVAEEFVTNLYPNPTNEFATFTFNGDSRGGALNVQVQNELGMVVKEYNYTTLTTGMPSTLRLFDLEMGTYNVVFTQGDHSQMQKLVILDK